MGTGLRRNQNNRESWIVTNLTKKLISIGDLLMFPVLGPGKSADLLQFYNREKISQSIVLPVLVKRGWLKLEKQKTGELKTLVLDIDDAMSPCYGEHGLSHSLKNEFDYASGFEFKKLTYTGNYLTQIIIYSDITFYDKVYTKNLLYINGLLDSITLIRESDGNQFIKKMNYSEGKLDNIVVY